MRNEPSLRSPVRLRSDVRLYPDLLMAGRMAACMGQTGTVTGWRWGLCRVRFAEGTLWLAGEVLDVLDDHKQGEADA